MRRVTLSLATVAGLLAMPLTAAVTATPAQAAGGLTGLIANYAVTSSWSSGFEASYTITNNTNATVNTWSLSFDLPAGENVTSAWNGTLTSSGSHFTITAPSWAGPLAPGATAAVVGFDVSTGGTPTAPANCTINNAPCAGLPADATPPTTPTGLKVADSAPGAVSLSWNASTDNQSVAGYHLWEGGAVVATVTGTSATLTGLIQGSSHSVSVSAFDPSGNESPASAAVTAVAGTGSVPGAAAPYVDLGAYPTPSLTTLAANSGLKQFSLAFVINGSTPCSASWFGAYDATSGWDKADIDAFRATGGDVRVSFGGANGTELAQSCTTVAALQDQYQKVVDAYGLDRIDFDIEGTAVTDHASIDRRSQALAQLQAAEAAKGRDLRISLTLPVLPSGLTADGLYVLQSAKAAGLNVDVVNVMAMDFGDSEAPNPAGRMGTYAIESAQATQAQILSVWTTLTAAQAWLKVGVTPMLGQNDNTSEVFGLSDASQLVSFAQQNHLGELAFWEMTRDANACTGGGLSKCTNIAQTPYEFSKIFAGFTG
ncbi:cellulose binding domain-containing protein [Streptacidiphilus jiangxiensis]|uniref:Glycosyl hydrolases family 18 n=1 Tax=Streptacidiphilus jiangxiensis TaxID=235985 RepID=A0A1H7MU03_STRJI|nr:cellulose binding domain-containing protein [Streptacidiphilus jiangxiensis]SEL14742.1 Glycosyl hydrolases family 18 [Streptacidiphilus jiangxiensis]